MSNSATVPSLWDDKKAANLDEPGLLLYRSNLLGADLRITNFGGGNTSAKVTTKDPLTGDDVTVLWVKGSGGDIGSMKLDGFATLYMDKLECAEEALQEPRSGRRDGARAQPLHLQSQSARALDRHLPAWLSCPMPMSITSIPTRSSPLPPRRTRAPDQGDLRRRDGLPALAAPGHRSRHQARRHGRGAIPKLSASCSAATASSPGRKTAKDCYETTLRIINKAAVWLERERQASPLFGGETVKRLAGAGAAQGGRAALMPEIRGRISKRRDARSAISTDAPRGAGIRELQAA